MQHHQIDEFSVTDIRHTIHEMWRVISMRRWYFVFPICAVSTIAFLCALMVPRMYRASTVIKREHDPVFETIGDEQWTQPYQEIRARIDEEIRNTAFLEDVLATLGLPEKPVARNQTSGDAYMPAAPADPNARTALARKISQGLSTSTVDSMGNRELIRISLKMNDPTHIIEILRTVRNNYVRRARTMTIEIMEDVKGFLQAESVRCRDRLDRLQRQVVEYELKYPGINPNLPDPTNAEQSALMIERMEVERQREELAMKLEQAKTRMAQIAGVEGQPKVPPEPTFRAEPNPRYAELTAEIMRLRQEIADGRMLRGMTDAHPTIQSNRRQLEARQAELADTPRVLMVSAPRVDEPGVNLAEMDNLKSEIDGYASRIDVLKSRLERIREHLGAIDHRRILAMEHRREYMKVSTEATEWATKLAAWRKHIAPIQEALYLEDQDRSIHLATVQESTSVGAPVAPDSNFVMVICLGIGLAAAVIVVLSAELIDRSYRTVKQLSTSIGVPVIESIDEIMTAAMHRRRRFRHLVLMPAVGVFLLSAMVCSGAMVYLSLKEPGDAPPAATISENVDARVPTNNITYSRKQESGALIPVIGNS
ncbi:MAG: GumC family protein [Phycisphaerae bacterium]